MEEVGNQCVGLVRLAEAVGGGSGVPGAEKPAWLTLSQGDGIRLLVLWT